jgi:hypothetical protein
VERQSSADSRGPKCHDALYRLLPGLSAAVDSSACLLLQIASFRNCTIDDQASVLGASLAVDRLVVNAAPLYQRIYVNRNAVNRQPLKRLLLGGALPGLVAVIQPIRVYSDLL